VAKFLKDLLDAKEPHFTNALHSLEQATGHDGVDVRLIADIMTKAHDVMRRIGLDPADTTARELYNGLSSHADDSSLFVDTSYVGLIVSGETVSFNQDDIRENEQLPYERRTTRGMRCQLQHELVERYMTHARTDEAAVTQFAKDASLDRCDHSSHAESDGPARPSVVSIGDIFTDAFIKLREDKARIDTEPDGSKRLSMEFGSKPPYEQVDIVQAVGPSPNAAVAFSRLGLDSSLMAFLGNDQPGYDSISYLKGENVDTTLTTMKDGVKSNYYYVLRYGADRTILVKNEAYDYVWKAPRRAPDWLYLSLISSDSWQLHEDMLAYLGEHPETKLAFQPGTFHFEWGVEKLRPVYRRAYIVVMNREEAVLVTGKSYDSLHDLAQALHDLGPKVVVITDGPAGAYASDGNSLVSMPNYPDPAPPNDRTGAGDAFASTIVAALALGQPLDVALRWAPINSMSVVQQLGAQAGLLRQEKIEEYLARAPESYRTEEIE